MRSLNIFNIKTRIIKADANVSIKESGYVRVEIKNITGFKEMERALIHEIERQKKELAEEGKIVQETRGWDAQLGITKPLRTKETEEDYGYIFDPDLVRIDITEEMQEKAKSQLPELPNQKLKRYVEKLKINQTDAQVISSDFILSEMFDRLVKDDADSHLSADWIRRELPRVANYNKKEVEELLDEKFEKNFIELIELLSSKKITSQVGRDILNKLAEGTLNLSPKQFVEKEGLGAVSDSGELEKFCEEAIKENPKAVEDYKKGEEKSINFLVGQVMRKSKGKASPDEVKKIIKELI